MIGLVFLVPRASGEQIVLTPDLDNTLYEDPAGGISNGVGEHLFVGRVGIPGSGRIRRALLRFPVSAMVPPGSIVENVTLTMRMTRTPTGAQTIALRRLLADWGEGVSDAPLREGIGAAAETDDATWRHSFFNTTFWASNGGDYSPTVSGSAVIGGVGMYTWSSTSQMVSDVQGWLDVPATNFGWILIGNETATSTVKRFSSRESLIPPDRPVLTIQLSTCECSVAGDCDDDTVCTFDSCDAGLCGNTPVSFGNVNGDAKVDVFDILCVLDGFAEVFDNCAEVNLDLSPCPQGDGVIDVFDILAVLDGFAGDPGCCPP